MRAAQLIVGEVHHARSRPAVNAFRYPIFNVRLPLANLSRTSAASGLSIEKPGLMSFYAKDHGPRDGSSLSDWAHAQLRLSGIEGRFDIELVCLPRVLGFVFNPVSFWLCWDERRQLRAIIAEVNNTFRERFSYVLQPANGVAIQNGETLRCAKRLHVSPFNEVRGDYRFRAFVSDAHFVMRIEYDTDQFAASPLLITSVSGRCEPITSRRVRRLLLTMPFITIQVVAKIHWQALKLIGKRVRFLGYLPSEGKR